MFSKVGKVVMVNSFLTTDPVKKQGRLGVVESVNGDTIAVKFPDGVVGLYSEDCFEEPIDELNTGSLFSNVYTDLLLLITNGIIDAKSLAIKELKKRGLDTKTGEWVGFK